LRDGATLASFAAGEGPPRPRPALATETEENKDETVSDKQAVHTEDAPAAIGPYSQGVWAGSFFFSAGQIGLDPETGELVSGGVAAETRRVFQNLAAVLEAADLILDDVVKTSVFMADMNEFGIVNDVYAEHFETPYPARSTVEVARLPKDGRVEIEVVARKP